MMFLNTLRFFLVILLLLGGSTSLSAQGKNKNTSPNKDDKSAQTKPIEQPKFDKETADLSEEKCPQIREGSSTIEKIAGLKDAMSVRNLTFKYFDKALFNLTDYDYEHMKVLKPICDNSSEDVATLIFDKLKEKVEEAKETRNNTVSWIKNTTEQLKDLPSDGSSIRLIHNAWKEMENRSHEMLATDLRYLADFLDHLLKKHYQKGNTNGVKFISPFIPPDTTNNKRQ